MDLITDLLAATVKLCVLIATPIVAGLALLLAFKVGPVAAAPFAVASLPLLAGLWWLISGAPPMLRLSRPRSFETGHYLNTRYRALLLVPVVDRGRVLWPGRVHVTDTASGWGHFDRWLRVRAPGRTLAVRVGD